MHEEENMFCQLTAMSIVDFEQTTLVGWSSTCYKTSPCVFFPEYTRNVIHYSELNELGLMGHKMTIRK